jgi:hypothetical protein
VAEGVEIEEGLGGSDKIFPSPFCFSPLHPATHAISLLAPSRAAKDSVFHLLMRDVGALRTVLCNNVGELSQSNELFFVPPMRVKESPRYQTRPRCMPQHSPCQACKKYCTTSRVTLLEPSYVGELPSLQILSTMVYSHQDCPEILFQKLDILPEIIWHQFTHEANLFSPRKAYQNQVFLGLELSLGYVAICQKLC